MFDDGFEKKCENCKHSEETNVPFIGDSPHTYFYCHEVDDLMFENGYCDKWEFIDECGDLSG